MTANPTKLHLGCGVRRMEGYAGIDRVKTNATDYVFDLEQPNWPFEDSSIDEVVMIHFLEHIHDHIGFFRELYRVMKNDGEVKIRGPHALSSGAWQDPTHTKPLHEEFFLYFDNYWRLSQGINYADYGCDFVTIGKGYILNEDYQKWKDSGELTEEQLAFDMKHKFNVAQELMVVLRARKQ